ncbi:retrovirus-related pol polyprotein from transposon TNT 1-94, partial [Tanacetum coccineum]
MPTKIELTLEQSQQGVSNDVLMIIDIEDNIMDLVMQCTTIPSHSGGSLLQPPITKTKNAQIESRARRDQSLDDGVAASFQRSRIHKPHAHTQAFKVNRTVITKQERECKLYDEFDKFTYKKGESLHEYYLRFTLLLNDMNIYKMPLEQFQVNTKFLNTLPDEWSKFVTDVKFVKDLHTTNVDQLHAYLQQHERHANEVRLMHARNSNPLALVASHQLTQPAYQSHLHTHPKSLSQLHISPYQTSHLVVPVFQKGDDPINVINHMMSFLTAVVTSRYPTTKTTAKDSSKTPSPSYHLRLKSYCANLFRRDILLMPAEQQLKYTHSMTKPKRKRDYHVFNDKVLPFKLSKCQALTEEENSAFLADPGLPDIQTSTDTKIALMANLSRNGSDALTESRTEITSDSNIIPYSQYLSEAQQETVQNSNSSAQQDVMIISMFEQLTTQVTHCTNVNLEYKSANQALTTDNVRVVRLKQNLFEQVQEKDSLMKTVSELKNELKSEENRNIDREIALEKKIKQLDNIIFKRESSESKPKRRRNTILKMDTIVIPDSDETLMLCEESRSKLLLKEQDPMVVKHRVNTKPINYAVLNNDYYKRFVRQSDLYSEHAYWKATSSPALRPISFCPQPSYLRYTKVIQDLLSHISRSCPSINNFGHQLVEVIPRKKDKKVRFAESLTSTENTKTDSTSNIVSNKRVLHSTGVRLSTSASGSQPSGNTRNDRIPQTPSSNSKNKVEAHPRNVKSSLNKRNGTVKVNGSASVQNSKKQDDSDYVCVNSNDCMSSDNLCVSNSMNVVKFRAKPKQHKSKKAIWKPTGKVFTQIGYIWRPTGRTFTIVGNACPLTRITTTNEVPSRKPIVLDSESPKPVVKLVYSRKPRKNKNTESVSKTKVVQIVLWYLDSGCSKHMTGDRSQLTNFISKFLGTVKFGNDQVAKIMGFGDYQIGNVTISRVYYVEGLGHNLFSVGQFCDSNLEVAFRQHTCFIRNLDGVDLLTGSRGDNLYTLSLGNMMASSPIFNLARHGLVRGLPKLKFEKDHLCSACALGKSSKKPHKPKSEDTNQEKLYLLHMDLCGPIRVASVNGKKYILVIVDDYSRFTWVKCLRSKDEAPAFIINFLKMIQVRLKETVRRIRTDNELELLMKTFREYYEQCFLDITHEESISVFTTYVPDEIIETIHVEFDEADTAMASEHSISSDPLFMK